MKKIIWNAITYINRTLTVIISVCAFLISNLDASQSPPPFLKDLLLKTQEFLKGNAWWIIVYSIGLQFTLWLVKKFFLSDPKLNEAITAALDNARTFLIDEQYQHTDPEHHHRVTLFKHTGFCYRPRPIRSYWWFWGRCGGKKVRHPFSGWLVPVARSGHTTKNVRSVFLAPDDAEHSEGIAGKAWSQSGPIYKNDLIELHSNSNDTNVGRYSKACFIDPQWTRRRLNNRKPRARSYLGFKINLNDQAWGVIVVDSTRPDGVKNPQALQQQLAQLELLISSLLKREVL